MVGEEIIGRGMKGAGQEVPRHQRACFHQKSVSKNVLNSLVWASEGLCSGCGDFFTMRCWCIDWFSSSQVKMPWLTTLPECLVCLCSGESHNSLEKCREMKQKCLGAAKKMKWDWKNWVPRGGYWLCTKIMGKVRKVRFDEDRDVRSVRWRL